MKKFFATLILSLVTATTLIGCSGGNTITMATNAEFEPFEYVTSRDKALHGELAGVDIAIGIEIAKEVGKELKIENMEFQSLLTVLPQGKADFVAAGLTVTEERLENMDFSIPYFVAQQVMVVRADDDTIKSADDLKQVRVAAIQGFTGETVCVNDLDLPNFTTFRRGTDAIMELKNGRIDAFVIDAHTGNSFVLQNSDLKVVTDDAVFGKEEYAIAVKKGNTELLESINAVLTRLLDYGQINAWFDEFSEGLTGE